MNERASPPVQARTEKKKRRSGRSRQRMAKRAGTRKLERPPVTERTRHPEVAVLARPEPVEPKEGAKEEEAKTEETDVMPETRNTEQEPEAATTPEATLASLAMLTVADRREEELGCVIT